MSRKFTNAEEDLVKTLAAANPDELRTLVGQLVPPPNMVSTGARIPAMSPVAETSVRIPDSYRRQCRRFPSLSRALLGRALAKSDARRSDCSYSCSYYGLGKKDGNEEGLFLGCFDLGNDVGKKPIFVLGLTEALSFSKTVRAQSDLPNGEEPNPFEYDANQELREGKTAIATFDMVWAAYRNQNKFHVKDNSGKLQKMFKDVDWALTSSPNPEDSFGIRVVNFRDGGVCHVCRGIYYAPSLLVRAALIL